MNKEQRIALKEQRIALRNSLDTLDLLESQASQIRDFEKRMSAMVGAERKRIYGEVKGELEKINPGWVEFLNHADKNFFNIWSWLEGDFYRSIEEDIQCKIDGIRKPYR